MNRLILLTALALAAANGRAGTDPAPTNAPAASVALIAIGEVPEGLAEHARSWAQQNLALRVEKLPAERTASATLDDIARQALKASGDKHAHVVAVAQPPEGVNSHGMRTADRRAAVVNLRPMRADKPDERTLERRVERQVLRAVSLMLDLTTCVNPQCALAQYTDLAYLDTIGRNLCPPCLQKCQKAAEKDHLHPDRESPFYIGN